MEIRASMFSETIRAVVIGVGKCVDPDLAELGAVAGEAQRVHDMLVSPNASRIPADQVSCLTAPPEATRERILSTLQKRASDAKPGDILFFYFAGHGIEHDGSFALVPSDGFAGRPDTLITAGDLGRSLAGTSARGVFIVADCCGGAAIYESARDLFGAIDDRFEFRILLSSSKRGESSWEISGRGSPFTAAFIEALQGRMPGIGEQGEIYFTSLMAHVTSRVAELLEGQYSGLPPQHPNFDGSYEKDPLIFVNSDIAIGRLVLKTARYSPEYVRRRVGFALGGLVSALAIMIVAYWTWLDQHLFYRLDGMQVALYHGYPGFPWPGMPQLLWQPNYDRSVLDPRSQLAKGQALILAKDLDPRSILISLAPSLSTIGKINLASQVGQTAKARTMAKTALDTHDPTVNPIQMLSLYAGSGAPTDDDMAMFASVIKNDATGQVAAAVFPKFLLADPDQAIVAINKSQNSHNPNVLYGLGVIQPPCSANTRKYLYDLIRGERAYLVDFAINAAIQAQCQESPQPLLVSVKSRTKTLGYYSLTLSDAYRKRFTTRVLKQIKQLGESGWNTDNPGVSPAQISSVEISTSQLAFSGAGPCDMTLIAASENAGDDTRLDIFEYLLNSCSNLSFQIEAVADSDVVEIFLLDGGDVKAKVLMDVDESETLRDRTIDFIQRRASIADYPNLIDYPIASYIKARSDWTSKTSDVQEALNVLQWAVQLKYWSPAIEQLLNDPAQPASIRKWSLFAALRAAPTIGTPVLLDRYGEFQFDYDGFIKMVAFANLPAPSIADIRNHARLSGQHDFFNIALTVLFGSSAEVTALLTSALAAERASAVVLMEFRDDVPEIIAAARPAISPFDVGMQTILDNTAAEWTKTKTWLANISDSALDWRSAPAGQLYGPLTGHSLQFLAAINTRKARGIERPFKDALLQFPSWQ